MYSAAAQHIQILHSGLVFVSTLPCQILSADNSSYITIDAVHPIDSRNARRYCTNGVHTISLVAELQSMILIRIPIPGANKRLHFLTAPIDAVLIPLARSRQFYELGGHAEAEAGESAGDAVAVPGDALFPDCGIDAVVCVLCGEGAPESHRH